MLSRDPRSSEVGIELGVVRPWEIIGVVAACGRADVYDRPRLVVAGVSGHAPEFQLEFLNRFIDSFIYLEHRCEA